MRSIVLDESRLGLVCGRRGRGSYAASIRRKLEGNDDTEEPLEEEDWDGFEPDDDPLELTTISVSMSPSRRPATGWATCPATRCARRAAVSASRGSRGGVVGNVGRGFEYGYGAYFGRAAGAVTMGLAAAALEAWVNREASSYEYREVGGERLSLQTVTEGATFKGCWLMKIGKGFEVLGFYDNPMSARAALDQWVEYLSNGGTVEACATDRARTRVGRLASGLAPPDHGVLQEGAAAVGEGAPRPAAARRRADAGGGSRMGGSRDRRGGAESRTPGVRRDMRGTGPRADRPPVDGGEREMIDAILRAAFVGGCAYGGAKLGEKSLTGTNETPATALSYAAACTHR